MALQTYRFRVTGPSTDAVANLVSGAVIMGTADLPVVDVQVDSSQLADLEEAMKSFGFVLTTGGGGTFQGLGTVVLYWTGAQTWTQILAQINAVPAESGVIVMMAAGTYTMDVAANLDRVKFISLVASSSGFSGYPTTINMVAPFALLGNALSLENIIAVADTTIWSGVGPFYLQLEGSSALTPLNGASPSTIVVAAGGVLNAAVMDYSLFGGGAVETAEQGDASIIHFLLTGASIIGDKASKLSGGAVAANVDYTVDATCVVAGVNGAFGTAFGAGITVGNSLNGNAFFGPYNATTPADWNGSSPSTVGEALDRIAAALGPIP